MIGYPRLKTIVNKLPKEAFAATYGQPLSNGSVPTSAEPLTFTLVIRIVSNCSDDLKGMRNRVLLQLGYETMRRRYELCAFRFEDLEIRSDAKPILHLRKSKADQESIGRVIPISTALGELIQMWREKISASSGFIIRGIDKHGNASSSLSPGSIQLILNFLSDSTTTCDLENTFSGHHLESFE